MTIKKQRSYSFMDTSGFGVTDKADATAAGILVATALALHEPAADPTH